MTVRILPEATTRTRVRRVQRLLELCVLLGALICVSGCHKDRASQPEQARSESGAQPSPSKAEGEVQSASAKGTSASAKAVEDTETPWTIKTLTAALQAHGWSVDAARPTPPDIATPDGTEVDGITIQRDAMRGDVFLYHYPLAGYAKAHQRAQPELGACAIWRRGRELVTVYSRDVKAATAILDALPLALGDAP